MSVDFIYLDNMMSVETQIIQLRNENINNILFKFIKKQFYRIFYLTCTCTIVRPYDACISETRWIKLF